MGTSEKVPILHGLYVKEDSPSPFTDPPCKTNLVYKGLSTVGRVDPGIDPYGFDLLLRQLNIPIP